jgi:hypothetical protein
VRGHGGTTSAVHDAIRIAAIVNGVATARVA